MKPREIELENISLVRCENLEHFGNTLTTAHISACHTSEKFQQHVQTPLSQKPETLSDIFIAFLQSPENLAHFEKKYQLYRLNISEVIDSEKCGYLNSQNLSFQNICGESRC